MKITLAGTGVCPGDISVRALSEAKSGKKVILRTALSETAKWLRNIGVDFSSLDFVYEKSRNFDTLAKNLAKEVLNAAKTQDVVYLVDGDVSEDVSCSVIRSKRKDAEVIPCVPKSAYFMDKSNISSPYLGVSAYDIKSVSLSLPLVVFDVDCQYLASNVKLVLQNEFGDEIPCYKFFNGNFKKIKLYEADYGDEFDGTAAIVVDKLDLTEKQRFSLYDLDEILRILRGENGCPWDKAQTPESIMKNTVEETYELLDAIKSGDDIAVSEEVGDLLLQAFFYIRFAEERGAFTLQDVSSGICNKLISRHTHIFGADRATDDRAALDVWEKNKQKEKGFNSGYEYLSSVPKSFPSVLRADKVGSRSGKYNMDFESVEQVSDKVKEEFYEVLQEYKNKNEKGIYEECGDLLFAVVSFVRLLGVNGELSLNDATDKFLRRFKKTEELAFKDGKNLKELSAKEIDRYYNESKKG